MRVAKTKGLSATVSGTVLPPLTPARISWNMSAAYRREQDGQAASRLFPHRTTVDPNGSSAEEYVDRISPVARSRVVEAPTRWTGFEQNPTREAATDHPSRLSDSIRARICLDWCWSYPGRCSWLLSSNWGRGSPAHNALRVSCDMNGHPLPW
ncbi:hypothetical protein ASG70_11870 [Phycicoccus sp. Soil748]|nr:hypothetical protein ASG70_11870 [Phycicoccus sp. Soil748]